MPTEIQKLIAKWRKDAHEMQQVADGNAAIKFDEMTRVRSGDCAEAVNNCAGELEQIMTKASETPRVECGRCGGTGEMERPDMSGEIMTIRCPYCKGTGQSASVERVEPESRACRKCGQPSARFMCEPCYQATMGSYSQLSAPLPRTDAAGEASQRRWDFIRNAAAEVDTWDDWKYYECFPNAPRPRVRHSTPSVSGDALSGIVGEDLSNDEKLIARAISDARSIQEFLFDGHREPDRVFELDFWIPLFEKRVEKIAAINLSHPNARVELRKRLLQQASLSIRALAILQGDVTLIRRIESAIAGGEK